MSLCSLGIPTAVDYCTRYEPSESYRADRVRHVRATTCNTADHAADQGQGFAQSCTTQHDMTDAPVARKGGLYPVRLYLRFIDCANGASHRSQIDRKPISKQKREQNTRKGSKRFQQGIPDRKRERQLLGCQNRKSCGSYTQCTYSCEFEHVKPTRVFSVYSQS
jgi:hypothetical protein